MNLIIYFILFTLSFEAKINSFILVNTITNEDIMSLVDKSAIDLSKYPAFGIYTENDADTKSVVFSLDDKKPYRIETISPYKEFILVFH